MSLVLYWWIVPLVEFLAGFFYLCYVSRRYGDNEVEMIYSEMVFIMTTSISIGLIIGHLWV